VQKTNHTVFQGTTLRISLELQDAAGAAVDISGVSAELRVQVSGSTVTFAGVTGGAAGTVVCTVDRTVTAAWPIGVHSYQIWLDYGEGQAVEEEVIAHGFLTTREAL
jgi:hypothetical protein